VEIFRSDTPLPTLALEAEVERFHKFLKK